MAGSYLHAVNSLGQLSNTVMMTVATETQGDAYETIEEMYGMIWYLANGDAEKVEEARQRYLEGLRLSPGKQHPSARYPDDDGE